MANKGSPSVHERPAHCLVGSLIGATMFTSLWSTTLVLLTTVNL